VRDVDRGLRTSGISSISPDIHALGHPIPAINNFLLTYEPQVQSPTTRNTVQRVITFMRTPSLYFSPYSSSATCFPTKITVTSLVPDLPVMLTWLHIFPADAEVECPSCALVNAEGLTFISSSFPHLSVCFVAVVFPQHAQYTACCKHCRTKVYSEASSCDNGTTVD
jgi:hypothetical protein